MIALYSSVMVDSLTKTDPLATLLTLSQMARGSSSCYSLRMEPAWSYLLAAKMELKEGTDGSQGQVCLHCVTNAVHKVQE